MGQAVGGRFCCPGLKAVPDQANFCFVDTGKDSRKVFEALLRKGVIVRTGDIFCHPTHIRVTYGTEEQNSRFLKALKGVLAALLKIIAHQPRYIHCCLIEACYSRLSRLKKKVAVLDKGPFFKAR